MNVKFSPHERTAGLFLLTALFGVVLFVISLAMKQGWFDSKKYFNVVFENADGVHAGTAVQISGLKAGQVDDVNLTTNNKIIIRMHVNGSFAERIRVDSQAQLIRPFIIGERTLDISVGSDNAVLLAENKTIPSTESIDLISMMGGKNMGPQLERMAQAAEKLGELANTLLDKKRAGSLVKIFDHLEPLLDNASLMAKEFAKVGRDLNGKDGGKSLFLNLNALASEMNGLIPEMKEQNPKIARDLGRISQNLAQLTEDFRGVGVAMKEVGPQMPETTKRAIEALNETVVTLKALQKSFLLRSSVRDVKDEEKSRVPASNP